MRLQAAEFEDLRGAEASATIPISERLLNEAIQEMLPRSARVRDLRVTAQAGDRFAVRARIGSSPLLPAVNFSVRIERQPDLPSSPVLVLKLEFGGLLSLAGPALRFFDALPPGLRIEHDRLYVDLAALAERRQLGSYLKFISALRVNTIDGAVVLHVRGGVGRT